MLWGEPQCGGLAVIAPLTGGDLHNNFVKGCLVVRIAAPPSPARAWRRCASSIAERARRLSLLQGRGGWEERGCPGAAAAARASRALTSAPAPALKSHGTLASGRDARARGLRSLSSPGQSPIVLGHASLQTETEQT